MNMYRHLSSSLFYCFESLEDRIASTTNVPAGFIAIHGPCNMRFFIEPEQLLLSLLSATLARSLATLYSFRCLYIVGIGV